MESITVRRQQVPLRRVRTACILVVFGVCALSAACDKVSLLAPSGSTITLFATNGVIPVSGTTEIIATILELPGTPVQNGTLVTFTTTLGSIQPHEARTNNGKVTVRFEAGPQSGTAKIGAVSGGAKLTAEIEIKVGSAGAGGVLVTASPTTVPPTGGTVAITAIVTDASGNPLYGAPVNFTTSAGTLGANVVVTDENGFARTTLTTNRDATVTANVAGKTATVNVTVANAPTVSISVATVGAAGQPTTFSFTATAATGSSIQNVTVSFGDATSANLGAATTGSISHIYNAQGTYTATITATDN
ncbi:MAG: Ig-like domain-containing protein, partial [Acidobacteria bacterium]|nr:Ig-like domain-containing protein [Acidobacteriota bacterium]